MILGGVAVCRARNILCHPDSPSAIKNSWRETKRSHDFSTTTRHVELATWFLINGESRTKMTIPNLTFFFLNENIQGSYADKRNWRICLGFFYRYTIRERIFCGSKQLCQCRCYQLNMKLSNQRNPARRWSPTTPFWTPVSARGLGQRGVIPKNPYLFGLFPQHWPKTVDGRNPANWTALM